MSFGETIAAFLGRLILAWFFLSETSRYAQGWNSTVSLLVLKHVQYPQIVLAGALLAMVLCSLSLFLGFAARLGALVLFALTVTATTYLHDYWHIQDAVARLDDYDIFVRNMAISGGLLVLVGAGPGKFAIDREHASGGKD
jgi:putative oxidoreductase